MGMPGMTNDEAAAYAAAEPKTNVKLEKNIKMTVAEFRNMVNPRTHYYDNYDCDGFLLDNTIDLKTKLEVLFGKFVVDTIGYDKLTGVLKEMR